MNLKELLGDELFAQVEAKINAANATQSDKTKHIRYVDLSEGQYVGKEYHNAQIAELKNQQNQLQDSWQAELATRDGNLKELQAQLDKAQTDAGQLAEAQKKLADMQTKYDAEDKLWKEKFAAQELQHRLSEKANELKFSSPAAKRDYMRQALDMKFKVNEKGVIFGYDDFLNEYKTENPGAIVDPTPDPEPQPNNDKGGTPTPNITLPGNPPPPDPGKKMSLSEAMAQKNANPNLKINF